jgi:polysaccharide biosynthesis/export protein
MMRLGTAALLGALAIAACAGNSLDPPAVPVASPADSLLRPGDVLRVTVWRQPEFSGEYAIEPDSTVAHPLLQAVRVAGSPLSAVRARLRDFLLAYERDPRLVVEPLYPVVVAGEVHTPGLLTVPRGTTLSQAVARAGGPTERGRLDRVRLVRAGKGYELNLLSDDQRLAVLPIVSGDQVFVGHGSDFSFVRDALTPIATVLAAAAAVLAWTKR